MSHETQPRKNTLVVLIIVAVVAVVAGVVYFVWFGKKEKATNSNTATNNAPVNTNVVVTEAPFIRSGNTKIFSLKLIDGQLNYKTMTFYAGDNIQVNLTSDGQPVDFEFQSVGVKSTSGVFSTQINTTDPGGVYQLVCSDRSCGAVTVTVINSNVNLNTNATVNTNQSANTNSTSQITKVELQRLPAGVAFNPGINMATTTSFNVGDQYGIGVTGVFKSGDQLTHSITNMNGQEVLSGGVASSPTTGTNGTCCFALPSVAGQYNVKIDLNGVVAQTVPITVSE